MIDEKMLADQWPNNNDKRKAVLQEKILPHGQFVHRKFGMDWPILPR